MIRWLLWFLTSLVFLDIRFKVLCQCSVAIRLFFPQQVGRISFLSSTLSSWPMIEKIEWFLAASFIKKWKHENNKRHKTVMPIMKCLVLCLVSLASLASLLLCPAKLFNSESWISSLSFGVDDADCVLLIILQLLDERWGQGEQWLSIHYTPMDQIKSLIECRCY